MWHLETGTATIDVDSDRVELAAGDTLVIPTDVSRRIHSDSDTTFVVSGSASGQASTSEGAAPVSPPWIR
ncbi:cupin domain-containing protein [Nocardioides luteus]|uniref:cupin domain-containing protein n=1 Tax=Nocardioides luteus TaxID=1844 RepID=UPI003571031F